MEYTVKYSSRKTVSIEITDDGGVLVRSPFGFKDEEIVKILSKHEKWIEKAKERQKNKKQKSDQIEERKNELKQAAKTVIPPLVDYYSGVTGLKPKSIKITSAKKRFGSCGGDNSLCFSWRLMAYDKKAVEYVVLHEIAHIKHRNHSKKFYLFIEKYMPDYSERIKMLKN